MKIINKEKNMVGTEDLYNNFTIGTADHIGSKVYVVRPSEYAHDNWGYEFGNQYGELGFEFWAEASTRQEAESIIDAFVNDLESRKVA